MEKKTIYIIFAVALVLLFLIEPFAIGIIQSAGNPGSSNGGIDANATVNSLTGNAVANITIVRYEPYLVVKGNGSGVDAVKERLIANGVATYAVWSGDSLVVSLKSSKNVPSAASEFAAVNASSIATAYLSTSQKVAVTAQDGTRVSAEGTSLSMQISPLYEEGSVHEASFAVRVDDGQVTGMGQIAILPLAVIDVQAEAMLASPPQASYTVRVAWKDRGNAKPLVAAAGASYKERSFVYVANATKEALDAAVAGLPYVTGTQPEIISVDNRFADSESIGIALFQKGYTAVFPPSLATFSNASTGSADALLANLTAANMSADISSDWSATIRLPSVLSKDGKDYIGSSSGIELIIEGTGEPAANVTAMNVSVDFEASGSRITRITAVRPI